MDYDYYGYDYNDVADRFKDNHDRGFGSDDEWKQKHGLEPHFDPNTYIRYLTTK